MTSFAQTEFEAGIIYNKAASYQIKAPANWVLDNASGVSQGLHCVLYPKGFTWQNAPVVMYAQIDSGSLRSFIDFAVNDYKKEDPKFQHKLFKKRKAQDKYDCEEYDNYIGTYGSYERVAYIQVDSIICYVVFSSRTKTDFDKYAKAIDEVVDSFMFMGPVEIKE
jgi:hypothetical protein